MIGFAENMADVRNFLFFTLDFEFLEKEMLSRKEEKIIRLT